MSLVYALLEQTFILGYFTLLMLKLQSLKKLNLSSFQALEVTKELNCVTEFIKEAEVCNILKLYLILIVFVVYLIIQDWAKALDEQGALGKKGPLHGLPFSVKDNVCITGYDCTVGLSRFIDRPVSECAPMVLALKSLGAIPFCKTNIPQTMLRFDRKKKYISSST